MGGGWRLASCGWALLAPPEQVLGVAGTGLLSPVVSPGGVLLPVHPAREALPSPCCRGVTVPALFQQMDEAGGREK